jgi:hypothetical protein
MPDDHRRPHPLVRWFVTNTLLSGFFALLWLLLRSGPKPNRLAYPCQQAAFTTASLAFGAPLVAALVTMRNFAFRIFANRRTVAVAAVGFFASAGLWGYQTRIDAARAELLPLTPPSDYRADVFHVTDCPREPAGDRFRGLDNLLKLMGREGFKFHRSHTTGPLSGIDGLIGSNDVVVIKINYQWTGCGGTNTDLLRGLIRAIVDHPDGFTGEVVVGENTQFASADGFDRLGNNAWDRTLSPHDVVVGFRDQGHAVSISDWSAFRYLETDRGRSCESGAGYVVLPPGPGGRISYPKFKTDFGACVSLAGGVWDPSAGVFDRDRLKVINLPVLKPHANTYAVTAAVKNYMGVVTNELNTNSHGSVRGGLMGAVMAETGMPDLNILDCMTVNGNPMTGPQVSWYTASELNQLAASTDPIALDLWATTNILVPEFLARGFSPPWPSPDATPDDPSSVFRTYLDNSMNLILAGGYAVTNDPDNIDVHSWNGVPAPRHPSGRVGN